MATTINKQRLLTHLFHAARKAAEAEPESEPRPVLHEFIYALCREGASHDQAEQAFCNLVENFFDWNEMRVSSHRELEEALAGLPTRPPAPNGCRPSCTRSSRPSSLSTWTSSS